MSSFTLAGKYGKPSGGHGRGGSRKGRRYPTKLCGNCGMQISSNVFPQHVRACNSSPTEAR